MSQDLLLPIAPARVKALCVPIGQIKRERFNVFVDRLHGERVVYLRDISADGRPNRNMFSPLAFPDGAIFYDLTTHAPQPPHLSLSPFDLYREPLALLAIADGVELQSTVFSKRHSGGRTVAEMNIRCLYQDFEELRDAYPKILVFQTLIFDHTISSADLPIPDGVVTIPPVEQHRRTTMKTVMCDISALILAEMTGLARKFEAKPFIDSPGPSSMQRGTNGLGQDTAGQHLARHNSQFALSVGSSRSSSTSGIGDRVQARMSMPPGPLAVPGLRSSNSTPGRPSSPINPRISLSNPSAAVDDIAGVTSGSEREKAFPSSLRQDAAEGSRTSSQDRISVQGFGPGGNSERWRNKRKGRVQVVLGSMYLQAGRWADAVKELIEGATVAKSVNDHLWHGKGLELSLVCLLLLAWADIEFTIPTLLIPQAEKGSGVTPAAVEDAENSKDSAASKQPRFVRHLQTILPDVVDRIIGLYSRISAESLPPLPLSEAIIRFCGALSALHLCDGRINRECLDMMVLGTTPNMRLTTSPRVSIRPSRTQIVSTLFKAFPASTTEVLTTPDRIVIMSGIASMLGVLGFRRKKALVMRELVSVLRGGFLEARTRGAADAVIHPASGLLATNDVGVAGHAVTLDIAEADIEHGIEAFLGVLLKTHGVVSWNVEAEAVQDESDVAIVTRIQRQSVARFFGMRAAKINILRACIEFFEALPDLDGVLRFSSDLLRTAGSGVAPGPRREDVYPGITRIEQAKLVAVIAKTSTLTRRLGPSDFAPEYWDDFLLRGVRLEALPKSRMPIPHAKNVLPEAVTARASQDVNPFIYNPFLKQPDKAAVDKTLVAGELATFRLTLQNPYEIDLEIESVRLETEGVDFESDLQGTVLGPYRTQSMKIAGMPKAAGSLKVTGAIIHVRGCRARRFPIFKDPWAPVNEVKIKAIGLDALEQQMASPSVPNHPLKPEHMDLQVISEQPVLAIQSSSLPQSSVMVLEGERQSFSITVQNLSSTTPVDFLLFSFLDSTQGPLQAALSNRDATPAELYEYELVLAKKQALRLRSDKADQRFIAPGQTATFEFEILGKPGLTDGLIQIDYACLGAERGNVTESFFTRQVSLELTVTVNASVEVSRVELLPLHGAIPAPLLARTGLSAATAGDREEHEVEELTEDQYCLLLIDLRNSWPGHMSVKVQVDKGATIEEQILPGHTSRVVVPLKRIYLDDPHAPIPVLDPHRQRQFVVSTIITPDAERASREAFWYREKILDAVRVTWHATSGAGRNGVVELRSMRLFSRMVEAIKVDDIGIELSVEPCPQAAENDPEAVAASRQRVVFTDEFVQLRVRLTNRTTRPIYPTLRIMPALCHRPLNVALDFTRKLAWNGALQHGLPLLKGRESRDVVIGLTVLCRGAFDISASVEETRTRLLDEGEVARKKDAGGERSMWDNGSEKTRLMRPRSDTEMMMDAVLMRERRVWHTRRALNVVVRDRD